jgi:predicted nucleic acid-binding protein
MTGFVVDASVAIKWLVDEPLSAQAAKLLDDDLPLAAPELIYAEAANALWAIARRGRISAADVREALDMLADAPLAVPSSMRQLMAAAARLAHDLDHPVYDCLYLALALQEQRPVITADRRFYSVVQGHPYLAGHVVTLENLDRSAGS